MGKGNTTKYIKYATGEIILVVIGILIALQINTWNEARKDRIKEKALLTQLKKDLDQTRVELDTIKAFFKTKTESAQIVLHSYWTGQHLSDTTLYHFGVVRSNRKYNPILSTAKSLISSGTIELISSEPLKNAIITYTEKVQAKINDILRYEETYFRPTNTSYEFNYFNLIYNYEVQNNINQVSLDTLTYRTVPVNFKEPPFPEYLEDVYANRKIYKDYIHYFVAHRNTFYRYADIQHLTIELLDLLKEEGYD